MTKMIEALMREFGKTWDEAVQYIAGAMVRRAMDGIYE